jgi:MFS transporter, ACS family, solute carrier family 17 (sodium-dependent inorganic phosphate cotransporter), member 5
MLADWLISTNKFSITVTRKILNSIGQFGPAICLAFVAYTGCNRVLTVFLLTVGISLNGAIYSGFKVEFFFPQISLKILLNLFFR